MARLAVLIDRPPRDPEWKGAVAWNIILSLAESQHEVLALTTCDLGTIDVDHPRLNVARPASSFGIHHLPKWLQALFQFQPQVIHSFALNQKGPRALTIWPMLDSALSVMPRIQRYSTALSETDLVPFKQVNPPFELAVPPAAFAAPENADVGSRPRSSTILIPAAVGEWARSPESLLLLNEFLLSNREVHVDIIGGWGNLSLSERRAGWQILENVSQQIHMRDGLDFTGFVEAARKCGGIWFRSLAINSWRAMIAAHIARSFSLPTWGDLPNIQTGSTANYLSRLYSGVELK